MSTQRVIGPYQIEETIGRGGMGDVHRAIDTRKSDGHRDHIVALKTIWKGVEKDDPGVLEAERRGAELMRQVYLVEPRVVRVNEYGDFDDQFCINMEYVAGDDLGVLIKKRQVRLLQALEVVAEICEILHTVHNAPIEMLNDRPRAGVVHGDIKPGNVRVDALGHVRLLDFGIAKAITNTRKATRNAYASMDYSSPERVDTGEVDIHSDLWSVSIMLYQMVSGHLPFQAEDHRALERLLMKRPSPPPLSAEIPIPVNALLMKALAPRLEDRFGSADELRAALVAAREACRLRPAPVAGASSAAHPAVSGGESASESPGTPSDLMEQEATRRTVKPSPDEVDTDRSFRAAPAPTSALVEGQVPVDASSLLPKEPMSVMASPVLPENAVDGPPLVHVPITTKRSSRAMSVVVGGIGLVSMLVAGFVAAAEWKYAAQSKQLTSRVHGGLSCKDAWAAYRANLSDSILAWTPEDLSSAIAQKCRQEVEETMKQFWGDDPSLKKSDWVEAHDGVLHVMELTGNRELEAAESYTRGQVLRIEDKFSEATAALERALEQNGTFCDPFLALWQMYAYRAFDLAALEKTRTRFLERGCAIGKRQEIQYADALFTEATNLLKADKETPAVAERLASLEKTKQHLLLALEIFKKYPTYGKSGKQSRQVQQMLDDIQARVDALTVPPPKPYWWQ